MQTDHDERLTLAAIQMVSGPDPVANLQRLEPLLADAGAADAGLIVLPENCIAMGQRDLLAVASACGRGREIRQQFSAWAEQYQAYIVAGTLPLAAAGFPDKVYPASLVFDPLGRCIARYDKLHLFDVDVTDGVGQYRESDQFRAGSTLVDLMLPPIHLGLSICYDLRFPELYRALAQRGCNLFTVPAAFTYATGEAHWMTLLKARAIENQAYVVAANQGGWHGKKRRTYGHSCIISPWGEVLAVLPQGEGVVSAEFEPHRIASIRRDMPVQQHRRIATEQSQVVSALPEA